MNGYESQCILKCVRNIQFFIFLKFNIIRITLAWLKTYLSRFPVSSQSPTTFAQNCGKAPEVGCGQDFAGPILVFHQPFIQAVALEPVVHLLLLYCRRLWGSQQGCCMSQFSRTFLRFSSFLRVLR